MSISKIRERLAIEISQNEEWINKLDNSNPGHYGVEDWDVSLSDSDVWVDIPSKSFRFKNASFVFTVLFGSSNPEDGFTSSYSRIASGKGTFIFHGDDIKIDEVEVEFDLNLLS